MTLKTSKGETIGFDAFLTAEIKFGIKSPFSIPGYGELTISLELNSSLLKIMPFSNLFSKVALLPKTLSA